MRKEIINFIELMNLFHTHKREYIDYFLKKRSNLYKCLREHGCRDIEVVQPLEWKVWYGSYYFRGILNHKKVFIKVTAECTKDGYMNEVVCDNYIKKNSVFLSERTPKIILNFIYEGFHIVIFEYFEICKELKLNDLQSAMHEFVVEYSNVGIIHQDIKLNNLTIQNGKYCMIDYGYAICPDSNHIRVTTSNYIDYITDLAKTLLENADFYYDDIVASGMNNIDRNLVNFIVGSKDRYFIKLADKIYEYRLEKLAGRSVCLLHKQLVQNDRQLSYSE